MPNISRAYADRLQQTAPILVGNFSFFVDYFPVSVLGNPAVPHGKNPFDPHNVPIMVTGEFGFVSGFLPVCTTRSRASCLDNPGFGGSLSIG